MSFIFVDPSECVVGFEDFRIDVPAGLWTKPELLAALAIGGKFPDHFGRNWDALYDCMTDFVWIKDRTIVIAHGDLPLRPHPEECRQYLQLLRDAIAEWAMPAKNQSRTKHELIVLFPANVEADIKRITG